MPPRRPTHRAGPATSPRALSAMAAAARRARTPEVGGPDVPVMRHRPVPGPPGRSAPSEDLDPPVIDVPGLDGTPAGGAAPAGPSAVAPVMFFDAWGEERAGVVDEQPPVRGTRPGARKVRDTERRLRRAIAVVAAAIGIVVAALIGSVLTNGTAPGTSVSQRSSGGRPLPTTTEPPPDSTTTTAVTSATSTPPPPAVTSTGAPRPQPGGAAGSPVLTKLHPSSGVPGQSVEVRGSGFLGPSDRIRATVGGRTASVRCTNQTTCTVRIPPRPGGRTTDPVVVITDSGSSNPLTFALR